MNSLDKKQKQSRNKIQNALLTCLNTTSIQSITVKKLCEEAEINRSTFYRHYPSIEVLMSHTISSYFQLLFGEPYKFYLKHHSISESQFYIANNIFSHISHNAYFYQTMFKHYPNFYILLKNHIHQRYIIFFEDTGVQNDMILDKDIVAEYVASAYAGMIQSWVIRALDTPPDEMAQRLITLNSTGPIKLLIDAEKKPRQ
ncbi:TetR/AcrR family transcriptional regulator [Mammaliicoccus sciuri]|nr:TetR/AcrR family transcriptional regulator [Mammaliicoccus sciuri]